MCRGKRTNEFSKLVLILLIVISFMIQGLSYAQPKIPEKTIPADIPVEVRKQIERLYSKDPLERRKGAKALGEMGAQAAPAIPFLIGILGDTTDSGGLYGPVGLNAAFALADIGKPAVDPLIAALKDKNVAVRGHAVIALRNIKDKRAVNPLIVALKDKDVKIRQFAAEALGEIKDNRAVEPLIAILKDKNRTVLTRKVWSFDIQGKRVAKHEKTLEGAQTAAAKALGKIKDSRALESLISALKNEDTELKKEAAEALGNMEDKQAIEPLIIALKDGDYAVRRTIAEALGKITGQTLGDKQEKWQEWWERNKTK